MKHRQPVAPRGEPYDDGPMPPAERRRAFGVMVRKLGARRAVGVIVEFFPDWLPDLRER